MTPSEKATYLLELFNSNKDHAIKCAEELTKAEPDTFMSRLYWDEVIQHLND